MVQKMCTVLIWWFDENDLCLNFVHFSSWRTFNQILTRYFMSPLCTKHMYCFLSQLINIKCGMVSGCGVNLHFPFIIDPMKMVFKVKPWKIIPMNIKWTRLFTFKKEAQTFWSGQHLAVLIHKWNRLTWIFWSGKWTWHK